MNKHAYHIQIVHKLEDEDYAARQAMCYNLLDAVRNEHLMQHVLFSDEATFHTCGHVNGHNCRIWADEQAKCVTGMGTGLAKGKCVDGNHKIKSVRTLHVC